jgi:membrane-anchored mycosin MYCP
LVTPVGGRARVGRRARRVGVLFGLGAVLSSGPAGLGAAWAAGAAPSPRLRQTGPCIADRQEVPPLRDAVSAAQRALGFTRLWGLSQGQGVTVAVIDTGVNREEAFGRRLVGGGDLLNTGAPVRGAAAGLVDCDGHGTVVAGLIAASADRASGFGGVAPQAKILSIRQDSALYAAAPGAAAPGSSATLAVAIDRAVAAGADVINVSADECGPAATTNNAALTRAVDRAVSKNVVVVVAAGNLGSSPQCSTQNTDGTEPVTGATPANIATALTVAAVTSQGTPADFSLAGPWVDVAAPGVDVIATNPRPAGRGQVDRIPGENGLTPLAGTSFSAAYVSGTVALVRSRFPDLTAEQVVHRIVVTADHPAGPGQRTTQVGYGVVNPRRALTAVLPEEHPPVPAPPARAAGLPAAGSGAARDDGGRLALAGSGAVAAGLVVLLGAVAVRRRRAGAPATAAGSRAARSAGRLW